MKKKAIEFLSNKIDVPSNFDGTKEDYLRAVYYGASIVEKEGYIKTLQFRKLLAEEAVNLSNKKITPKDYVNYRLSDINKLIQHHRQLFDRYSKGIR